MAIPIGLPLLAEVLARRGIRAKLFRGADGLDELTTTGPSTVYDVEGGTAREWTFDPVEVGLPIGAPEDLRGETRRRRPRSPVRFWPARRARSATWSC